MCTLAYKKVVTDLVSRAVDCLEIVQFAEKPRMIVI